MKKYIIIAFLLILGGATQAQTTPAKKPKATTTKAKDSTAHATTSPAAGPTKKDGTPDMRYKANKTPPPQHLKKDGTPDMRYKENKAKKADTTKAKH